MIRRGRLESGLDGTGIDVAISRKIDILERSFYQLEEMVTDLE